MFCWAKYIIRLFVISVYLKHEIILKTLDEITHTLKDSLFGLKAVTKQIGLYPKSFSVLEGGGGGGTS